MNKFDSGSSFIIFSAACLKFKQKKYVNIVLKFYCNLFKTNPQTFIKNEKLILECLESNLENYENSSKYLLIALFNNYLCYFMRNSKKTSLDNFYSFIKKLDLVYIKMINKDLVNYVLTIGNAIFFKDSVVIDHLKTDKMKIFINSLKLSPPHNILLEEIKNYVNKL